jgi:hypothetical protein
MKQYNIFGELEKVKFIDNEYKTIIMDQPKNQKEEILKHLMEFGKITSLEAIKDYGVTRLADKVYQLRKEGFTINTEMKKFTNRYGNTSSYGIYKIAGI